MSQCVVIKKEQVDATLANAPTVGTRAMDPFKAFAANNGLPFKIVEESNSASEPELHRNAGDLWLCLEGEPIFVCGGEMVELKCGVRADGTSDESEWECSAIENGSEIALRPGDWLWIPPGQPHQHFCRATARMMIIKIPAVNK